MQITKQEVERLKLELERLSAINDNLTRQLNQKNTELIDAISSKNSLNITLRSLFNNCKILTDEIAKSHNLLFSDTRLNQQLLTANELNFEQAVKQLGDLVERLKSADTSRPVRGRSIISSVVKESPQVSHKRLDVSVGGIDRTLISQLQRPLPGLPVKASPSALYPMTLQRKPSIANNPSQQTQRISQQRVSVVQSPKPK